jgi:tRNA (guanine26-N2/guanine27-N2)-dimethyltransferase
VIANDLSPSATAAMTRNVELNGLGSTVIKGSGQSAEATECQGKVRVNEGDAR